MAAVLEPLSKSPAHAWRRRALRAPAAQAEFQDRLLDSPRPDRQQGVFETLLIVDGRPIELEAHLARLTASLRELFPDRSPPGLGEEVQARARRTELGSVRVTVAPADSDQLGAKIAVREIDRKLVFPTPSGAFVPLCGTKAPTRAVAIHSLVLAGGLGPHKWADRRLLGEAQAALAADALPIVVDTDGAVLEASRANAFAVRDGMLVTPPLDGRILPGITRARALEIAAAAGLDVREAGLSLDDLLEADEVFLTGSVRGVERVRALDGTALAKGGEIGSRLAAELRRTWTNGCFG